MIPSTRYARCSRPGALLILAAWFGLTIWGVALTRTQDILVTEHPGNSELTTPDDVFYRSVVDRVARGEPYYEILDHEFRKRQAPPASVFQYRLPVYAWLNAYLPGRWLLAVLLLIEGGLLCVLLNRDGGPFVVAVALFSLTGVFAYAFLGDIYLFTELWVGAFLPISLACYYFDRPCAGAGVALVSLLLRELTAPYVFICLIWALASRRRRETALLLAGCVVYSALFYFHYREVQSHLSAFPPSEPRSWVRFGGLAFVLSTVQLNNIYLIQADSTWSALVLPLALLGLFGWIGKIAAKACATVAAYFLLFWFVGQPFNAYWGLMVAPMLCVGIAWAPWGLVDLIRRARRA